MDKECETCIKRKTVYCPNSIECMATDDKPYYQNRIMLLEENKELKKKYLNAVADYETTMAEKEQLNSLVNSCQEEIRQLKKQLEDISEELELVRCDLHNRTSERDGYERELNECLSQQKEFIKWLENGINQVINTEFLDERIQRAWLVASNRVLQKYKKIIGGNK